MKDIAEVTKQLEIGVSEIFESGRYKEYLDCMSKFHDYSFNNVVLIMMQRPDASLVAGYKAWQSKFKRQVRKGEKGITIIAPCPHKVKKDVVREDGSIESVENNWTTYRATTVFDVSQTDGEDIPEICTDIVGSVDGYAGLIEKLKCVSPVPVVFEDLAVANGMYRQMTKEIVVKTGMSELQTVKTLIHEISHAILHDKDTGSEIEAGRNKREVQAESVAYTVCGLLGLDTSDYSFGYIAGWSEGKDVRELRESMETIRKTANEIMDCLRAA